MIIFKKQKLIILIFLLIIISHKIFINLYFYFNIYIIKRKNNILFEIDTSDINSSQRGPGSFLKGLYQIIPYSTDKCCFIPSSLINFFFKPDYYYFTSPKLKQEKFEYLMKTKIINNYIFGPNLVPIKWDSFPDQNSWEEKRFPEILNSTKGYVVHSERVRDHLSQRSSTTNYNEKFKIVRACSNIKPKKVNNFVERKIDILFFEKYADFNHSHQAKKLLSLFKETKKNVVVMRYGSYNKINLKNMANNSKFIIYFSFFDTGAIGLKEIQNYGVFAFTHQKDLVIDNETSFLIYELADKYDMKPAFNKIMEKIENISSKNPNSQLIAKINQNINDCRNALNDLCKNI